MMGMGFYGGTGFLDGGFDLFFGLFTLTFLAILGAFIFQIVKGIGEWNKNNHSPQLTVEAEVVSKRTNVTHHSGTEHTMGHSSTSYYVTFQVESGDRMELHLSGQEYGMLVEGDKGRLTFQGTRYLGFERHR